MIRFISNNVNRWFHPTGPLLHFVSLSTLLMAISPDGDDNGFTPGLREHGVSAERYIRSRFSGTQYRSSISCPALSALAVRVHKRSERDFRRLLGGSEEMTWRNIQSVSVDAFSLTGERDIFWGGQAGLLITIIGVFCTTEPPADSGIFPHTKTAPHRFSMAPPDGEPHYDRSHCRLCRCIYYRKANPA